jgi:TDG/mug DNA glycosylase family protein
MGRGKFKYGWQDECERMGPEGGYKGARVFVATTTSGLAASLRPAEKLEIWKPLGEWVQQRRAERAQLQLLVKSEQMAIAV